MRFKTVIFDLDDTLYPEWDYVRSGFHAVEDFLVSAGIGCAGISTVWYQMRRTGEQKVFDNWLSSGMSETENVVALFGGTEAAVGVLIDVFRGHEPDINAHPGIEELLTQIRNQPGGETAICLVSDGHLDTQRAKWKALGLSECFDVVVFNDELGREHWKPSPTGINLALAKLQREARDAVYIADNPLKDFVAAHRAGVSAIRLKLSDGVYSSIESSGSGSPDVEVTSIQELQHLLLGN